MEAEEARLSGRALLVWEREWGRVGEQADRLRKVVSSDLERDSNDRRDEPSLALKECFEYAGERPTRARAYPRQAVTVSTTRASLKPVHGEAWQGGVTLSTRWKLIGGTTHIELHLLSPVCCTDNNVKACCRFRVLSRIRCSLPRTSHWPFTVLLSLAFTIIVYMLGKHLSIGTLWPLESVTQSLLPSETKKF